MKKLIAMCLVLLMVAASASAAEWREGLSPSKPYENVVEVDFEKNIGHIMFYPNSGIATAGANMLFIYLPREDVKAGAGKLTLYSTDAGEELSVNMNDTTHVIQRAAFEGELEDLMWGSGTCFEVVLPVSLRAGTTYYVDMEKDCIVDVARAVGNPQIRSSALDNRSWHFTTVAEFGVSAMEYRRPTGEDTYENQILMPKAGDEVRFDLLIGGEAKCATIVIPKEAEGGITFDTMIFRESCEVTGVVNVDDPIWDVIFWDTEMPPMNTDERDDHIIVQLEF